MEIYTRKIEKVITQQMCTEFAYSEGKQEIIVLSTGAGLMMSVSALLSNQFSVFCSDLNGTIESRVEKIWTFSQFETPAIILLWLSLMPSSKYFELLKSFGTTAINTKLYLKGLIDQPFQDWENLGYELIGDLEDLTNLK